MRNGSKRTPTNRRRAACWTTPHCAILPQTRRARRATGWRSLKPSCRRCSCPKTQTTRATFSSKSALFAGVLLRMYLRYAERQRWQVEILSESLSETGGYKEVIARIAGHGAYSRLKFESGGHRVQRVPETEAQGRIHTSACTVAVLSEADQIGEVDMNPADLRV